VEKPDPRQVKVRMVSKANVAVHYLHQPEEVTTKSCWRKFCADINHWYDIVAGNQNATLMVHQSCHEQSPVHKQ